MAPMDDPDFEDETSADPTVASSKQVGAAPNGAGPLHRGPRREVVASLVEFLKEYFVRREDVAIVAMLRDIHKGGLHPRPLGKWGLLSASEVGDAVAAFEVWRRQGCQVWQRQGCLGRPVQYDSRTYGPLDGYVNERNQDGTLNIVSITPTEDLHVVRNSADPALVRPREVVGWFVPDTGMQVAASSPAVEASCQHVLVGGHPEADNGQFVVVGDHSAAANTGYPMAMGSQPAVASQPAAASQPVASSQPAVDSQLAAASQPAVASRPTAASQLAVARHPSAVAGGPIQNTVPQESVLTMVSDFDGTAYGPEYLVLSAGDKIVWLGEEDCWAKGKVVHRHIALPLGSPGALLDVGWYPPAFAIDSATG